jgi:hypothetical protein
MTLEELHAGVAALRSAYPDTRILAASDGVHPIRVAPVPMPHAFWGGRLTRLLVVFDLRSHASTRPRGLLGPEWVLPSGGSPYNASPVFEFGESWQAFSWNFSWPPAFGVVQTVEAYLGRFDDRR